MSNINNEFIASARKRLRYYKELGDQVLIRLTIDQLHHKQGSEHNSVAIIINHLAGNMKSRWTNFIEEDGEKPWRKRDSEFFESTDTKKELTERWTSGWAAVFDVIDHLQAADLEKEVLIRNESLTVVDAIHRQLAHYAYHTGQMILLAKIQMGQKWESLSIPLNRSEHFNNSMFKG